MGEQSNDTAVRLYLLGRFEVQAGDQVALDESWPRSKAKALLKLLALQESHSLHREQVLDALWPDLAPASAANNLRKNVYYLRSAFAERRLAPPVLTEGDRLALSPGLAVDIEAFEEQGRLAREAKGDAELYEQAISTYAGDLLPKDLYEEWTEARRGALRTLQNELLLEVAQLYEVGGKLDLAESRLQALLQADRLFEEGHRTLMRLHAQAGRRDRAVRQYQQCREILKRELGVDPSEETEALYREVAEGSGPLPVRAAAPQSDAVFAGREPEMAELEACLDDAVSGRGRLVLLAGEPGIGKTRTAEELASRADRTKARVLWGRCYEGEGAPPYWPWIQIIRSYVRNRDSKALLAEMGPGAADIAQVVPEVQERLPGLREPPALQPEQARFRFFDSVTTFLRNAAERQPHILVLDDLHWADKPSLLLLQFVFRDLRDARLLVIGTYRDMELEPQHPLKQTIGEVSREQHSRQIALHGLGREEVARIIEHQTGREAPEALVTAVDDKTEGNPFFVSEMVRLLASEGRLERAEEGKSWKVAIPQGVREVISRRLERLSEECRRVLAIASVVGREFSLKILEAATELSRERLLETLEEAITAQMVAEVPDAAGRLRFSHALIRETLYEELPISHRALLHRRIGELSENLFQPDQELHLEELAHHFLQAATGGGDVDKAIEYSVKAGRQALTRLAYEEVTGHYERALQAMELKEPDEGQRCELLLALGEAHNRAGDVSRAKEIFQQAADSARRLSAAELLARAGLGYAGPPEAGGGPDEVLIALLEDALRSLGEADSTLRAKVLARLALALGLLGSGEGAASLSQQAVEMARGVGDPAALGYVLRARHWVLWSPENVEDRLAIATEIIRLAEQASDKEMAIVGHGWRLADLLELGDRSAVDQETEAGTPLVQELRHPLYLSHMARIRANLALLEGRFGEVENQVQQALALGQRAQAQGTVEIFAVQIALLRREQGRLQELEAALKRFVEQQPHVPAWRCALASFYVELGREEEARVEFDRLAANNFADLPQDVLWLITVTLLSEVCAYLGDDRRAATLYELLLPYAQRCIVISIAVACYGSGSRYLGLLATTMSRWEDAVQHFKDALEMNAKMRARPFVAHTQHDYASTLLARDAPGDREKALQLLNQALDTAQELGMSSLVDKASALRQQTQKPLHDV